MDLRSTTRTASAVVLVFLASCGGGGGGGSATGGTGGSTPATVSGFIVKGPTGGATVQLQTVDGAGTAITLALTTTASDGSYAFNVTPPAGAVLLLKASGGTYVDEATGASAPLSSPLRALDVWAGLPRRISLTPYSEVAVRSVERVANPNWSAASIQAANKVVADWLGLPALLDFRPVDLKSPFNPSGLTQQDFSLSLYGGAFGTFARRLDANPATSLAGALEGLYQLILVDSQDDRLFPAFLGGVTDFIDLTTLSAEDKRAIKSLLLFASNTPLNDTQLQTATPHGISSGMATAAMPDDAFQLLGFPGGHTAFNKRGALIAYTTAANTPDWQAIYTASVAEMYGDGDVGIGRWNGGAIVSTVRSGDAFVPSINFLPYDSLPYAVARPPTSVPVCGLRRLALVANTDLALLSESAGLQRLAVGLTADSMVGLLYLGDVYLGADIGVRLADNSIVRFRSPGGVGAPWETVRPVGINDGVLLYPVAPAGALVNQTMSIQALVSGTGATKAAVRLNLGGLNDPTSAAAVFIASAGAPEATGCAMPGAAGPGISPHPVDGDVYVFLHVDSNDTYRGAPVSATFGTSGELTSARSASISGPVYELAGNADASIGRVMATAFSGQTQVLRSEPYAVVRPGATVPSAGTVIYDLVGATSAVIDRGGSGAEIPPGTVTGATLQITYGEYPLGTPNQFYGTALLHVTGTVGDVAFSVTGDLNNPSVPLDGRALGEAFAGNGFAGAVSAPSGDYAAVEFQTGAGSLPVNGTLLFKKRP